MMVRPDIVLISEGLLSLLAAADGMRTGLCELLPPLLLLTFAFALAFACVLLLASALITSPRTLRLLLMADASRRRSPLADVLLALSLPARSTMQILLVR